MNHHEVASPGLCILVDKPHTASPEFGPFSGWQWEFLRGKILRGGFSLDQVTCVTLSDPLPSSGIIVGLGETVLREMTGKRSIDKWQLSPLYTNSGRKFIPTFDVIRVQKQFELGLFQELAFRRAFEESRSDTYERIPPERFLLNPPLEEALAVLERIKDEPELAIDIETGYGQINTIGFAWSASDAIAINVLPDRLADQSYFELWDRIRAVTEAPSRKILQNFIYDVSYLSAYGIRVNNVYHDTMWGMKVLWPELKSNLGNVGRIYTKRPYWKDDGKVTDEEGLGRGQGLDEALHVQLQGYHRNL